MFIRDLKDRPFEILMSCHSVVWVRKYVSKHMYFRAVARGGFLAEQLTLSPGGQIMPTTVL